MQTRVLPFSDHAISEAARLILAGQPVAVPTETVYGLAADATNAEAVARIYEAKGRPSFNPLIVHVSDLEEARALADVTPRLLGVAEDYWPGPLTLVAPLSRDNGIASLVTAGLATIAVRIPAHPAIRALLRAVGRPLAAPSANASGSISATRVEHVLKSLGGRIPLVIDAGACPGGLESTIIREENGELRLLRPGPIEIAGATTRERDRIEAPGQLESHYAPSKPVRLDAVQAEAGEVLIGFGAIQSTLNLSESGDLVEAAAKLFDYLHSADAAPQAAIAVAPIPQTGIGRAINDRLRRASAPR